AQFDEEGGLVVRQPDLDVLLTAAQAVEADGAHRPSAGPAASGGHVQGERVSVGDGGGAGEAAVDQQLVHPVGPRGCSGIDALGGDDVQFEGGRRGAEGQPDAGGLRLGHGQPVVGDPPSRGRGQAVGQDAPLGALQVEGAAYQVGRQG